jgi:LuxR family quorum-sensing transcriptional regulator LasR
MALQEITNPPARKPPGLSSDLQRALQLCANADEALQGFSMLASMLHFDGLSYLVLDDTGSTDCVAFHLTTAGRNWSSRYAMHRYHAIDPRIIGTRDRHVPIMWTAAPIEMDVRARNFLGHAGDVRICSGVAVSLRDTRLGRIIVGWDWATRDVDRERKAALELSFSMLTLLAGFLHEAMLPHCLTALRPGAPATLSDRERTCLVLAAHGMTSLDIGIKLGITERTVNFHFGNIICKLGVLNRSEAIARAVAHNIVSLSH